MFRNFSLKKIFLSKTDKILYDRVKIITRLSPRNIFLYKVAFQYEKEGGEHLSNERLEFLGDAAISLIVGNFLFTKFPLRDEGFLTDIRSRIVNRESLGAIARKLNLEALLQYDSSCGRSRHIYGNALEALVGAVYLDRGYAQCYKFVVNELIHKYMDLDYTIANDTNYKSAVLEWASKNQKVVSFEITEVFEGSNAERLFNAQISIDEFSKFIGEGRSKKQAEQNAARKAWEDIQARLASVN